jgi:hypothetical protein
MAATSCIAQASRLRISPIQERDATKIKFAADPVKCVATEGLVTDSVGRHVRHSSSQREETLDNG